MHSSNEAHLSGLGTHVSASERDESSFEDDVVSGFEQASRTFGGENDSFRVPSFMRQGSHHHLHHGHAPLLAATQPFGENAQNNDIENFLTSPPVVNSTAVNMEYDNRPCVEAEGASLVHTPSVVVPVVSTNDAAGAATASSPVFTRSSLHTTHSQPQADHEGRIEGGGQGQHERHAEGISSSAQHATRATPTTLVAVHDAQGSGRPAPIATTSPQVLQTPTIATHTTTNTNTTRPVLESIETTQHTHRVHADPAALPTLQDMPLPAAAATAAASASSHHHHHQQPASVTVASLLRAEAEAMERASGTPPRPRMARTASLHHISPNHPSSPFLTTPPQNNDDRALSHTAAPSSHVFDSAAVPALQASVSHHGAHHVHSDQSFLTAHAAHASSAIEGGTANIAHSNVALWQQQQQQQPLQQAAQQYGPHSPLLPSSPRHVPATASYSSMEPLMPRAASPEARSDRSYGRHSASSTNHGPNSAGRHLGRHNSSSSYLDLDAAPSWVRAMQPNNNNNSSSHHHYSQPQHHHNHHPTVAASLPAHGGGGGISPRRGSGGGPSAGRSVSGGQSVSAVRSGMNYPTATSNSNYGGAMYANRYATSSPMPGRQGLSSGTAAWSGAGAGMSWARTPQSYHFGGNNNTQQPPVLIAEAAHHPSGPPTSSRPQWLSAVERTKREDYLGIYQNYDTLIPPEQNENLGLQGRRTMQQVPLTVSRINALKEGRLTTAGNGAITTTYVPTSPTMPVAPLFASSVREAELPAFSAYDTGRQGRPLSLSHRYSNNNNNNRGEHSVRGGGGGGETSSNGRGQPRSPTYSAPSPRTNAWVERQYSNSSVYQGGGNSSYYHHNNNNGSSVGPHTTRGRRPIVAHEEALHVNVTRSASPQSLQSRRHHVRASRNSPVIANANSNNNTAAAGQGYYYYNSNNEGRNANFFTSSGASATPEAAHLIAAESVRHGPPGQPATRLALTAVSSTGSSVNTISNRTIHEATNATPGLPSLFATEKATSNGQAPQSQQQQQQQQTGNKPGFLTAEEEYGKTHLVVSSNSNNNNNANGVTDNANNYTNNNNKMNGAMAVVDGPMMKYGELPGAYRLAETANAAQSSVGWGNLLENSENGGLRRRHHQGSSSHNNNNNNNKNNNNNSSNHGGYGGGDGGGGGGSGGGGNYPNQSNAVIVNEESKAVREVVANHPDEDERDERNFRTRNINAVHAIPWDQRRQLPMTGFGTRFFAILSSPRFWEKLDWTLRGSILTVLPTMILSMEPKSAPHFPLPSLLAFNAFWITMPTFGSGMREFYIALKGYCIGLVLSIVLLAIRPGSAWLTILLHFVFTLVTSFIGQETKKTCAFVLATIYMQYIISPDDTHYSYVRDYFFSILIALGFALAGFIIPFIRWSSEIARHYLVAMSTALSISVQGICSSFWTRSPLERELNVVRLRQLRVTAEKCIQKIDVAMSEMGYEPHTGRYMAQLRSRYEFCTRIHNTLGSMMTVVELIATEPRLIDTPMCTVFGQQIGDDLAIISSAMDSMILKIVDVRRPISVQELAFFREARERFQAALSRVREDVILTNENYEADESDVYLGFFMFSVDELCETIATFDPDVRGRNNLIYFLTFWWRDILSTLSAFKVLFLTVIRRRTITRRLKEAIKLALCMNIPLIFQVYALSNDATSPMAGSSIIALVYNPTGSESFHYASGRLQGTVIGSLAAFLCVQIAHGRRWVLYIFIGLLSVIGSYVQAAPGFYALGNAIVCSVISVMTQYDDQNAAMVRIQQNCFAILLYFVIVSVVWPMRGHTKVKMGLDVSLRCLRESTTRLLRNLDMPDQPLEVIADVSALLKEMSRKIALQVKFIPGAMEEPTLASAEFPEESWKDLVAAQKKLYLTLSMMCFAYQTFMSSRANNDTELSVHWVILRRISGYARDLSDLIYAAVDLYLISLAKVTVVPTAHLTRLRRSMMEAHMAILETYIRTVHRQVVGDDSTADNNNNGEDDDVEGDDDDDGGSGEMGGEDEYNNDNDEDDDDDMDPGMHVKDRRGMRPRHGAKYGRGRPSRRNGGGARYNSSRGGNASMDSEMSSNSAHYAASRGSFEARVSSNEDSLHGVPNNNNNSNAIAGTLVNVPAGQGQGQQLLLLANNQPGNSRDPTQPVQSFSFTNSSLGVSHARTNNNNNNNNNKVSRPGLSNSNNNNNNGGEANNEDNKDKDNKDKDNNNNTSGKKKTVYMSYNLTAEEKAALKALISTQANNSNLHRSFAVKASALLNAAEAGERTRTGQPQTTSAGNPTGTNTTSPAYNDSKMLALAGTNEDLAAKLRKKHGITVDRLEGNTATSNTNPVSPHSGDGIGAAPTTANANKNTGDEAMKANTNTHNTNNNNNNTNNNGGNMSPDVAMEVLKNSSFLKNTSFLGNLFKRKEGHHGRHDNDAEHSEDEDNNNNNNNNAEKKNKSKKSNRNNNNNNNANNSSSSSDDDDGDADHRNDDEEGNTTEPSEHEYTEAPGQPPKRSQRAHSKNEASARLSSPRGRNVSKAARQPHTTPTSPIGSELAVDNVNCTSEEATRLLRGKAGRTPAGSPGVLAGQKPPFAMASSAPTASAGKANANLIAAAAAAAAAGNTLSPGTNKGRKAGKAATIIDNASLFAAPEGMQGRGTTTTTTIITAGAGNEAKPVVQSSYVSLSITPPGVDMVNVDVGETEDEDAAGNHIMKDDEEAERASVQQVVNDSSVFGADEDAEEGVQQQQQQQPQAPVTTTNKHSANGAEETSKIITTTIHVKEVANGAKFSSTTSDSGPHSDHTADKPTTATANTHSTTPMCVSASDEKRLSEDPSHTPLQDDAQNAKLKANGVNGAKGNLSSTSSSGLNNNNNNNNNNNAMLDPNNPRVRWGSPEGEAENGPLGAQGRRNENLSNECENSSQRTSEVLRNISFFDADRGEFILTNHDIHSLEAFLFGTRALVVYINELQNALLEMQHESDLAKNL